MILDIISERHDRFFVRLLPKVLGIARTTSLNLACESGGVWGAERIYEMESAPQATGSASVAITAAVSAAPIATEVAAEFQFHTTPPHRTAPHNAARSYSEDKPVTPAPPPNCTHAYA